MTNTTANNWTSVAREEKWPTTDEEWVREYRRRRSVYNGGAYGLDDHERLGLFQATDSAGQVAYRTRRICNLAVFIADVDAAALSNGITIDACDDALTEEGQIVDPTEAPSPALQAIRDDGEAIWRRSGVYRNIQRWAGTLAVEGDLHLEVTLTDDLDPAKRLPIIVAHRPEHVRVRYNAQHTAIKEAVIAFEYVKANGETAKYRRTLTAENIVTDDDGRGTTEPNPLGVVPLVHIPFRPTDDPAHSYNAWHGTENAIAIADSARTLTGVIGARHAAPWIVFLGQAQPDDPDGQNANPTRALAMMPGADVKYLEASLAGVDAFVKQAESVLDDAAEKVFELLFTEAGAGASGTALSYRAAGFTAKMEPSRRALCEGLEAATGMARALGGKRPWTQDANVFEVRLAPALATDVAARAGLLLKLADGGFALGRDVVREAQAAGLLPDDADPGSYADAAAGEAHSRTARTVGLLGGSDPAPAS